MGRLQVIAPSSGNRRPSAAPSMRAARSPAAQPASAPSAAAHRVSPPQCRAPSRCTCGVGGSGQGGTGRRSAQLMARPTRLTTSGHHSLSRTYGSGWPQLTRRCSRQASASLEANSRVIVCRPCTLTRLGDRRGILNTVKDFQVQEGQRRREQRRRSLKGLSTCSASRTSRVPMAGSRPPRTP
jgi:hypothetical protein